MEVALYSETSKWTCWLHSVTLKTIISVKSKVRPRKFVIYCVILSWLWAQFIVPPLAPEYNIVIQKVAVWVPSKMVFVLWIINLLIFCSLECHRLFIVTWFIFYGVRDITNHRNGLNQTTGNKTRPLRYDAGMMPKLPNWKQKIFLGVIYKIKRNICRGRHARFYY
jgi:hypothetical protein